MLLILEELIEWINGHEGVEWVTMEVRPSTSLLPSNSKLT